MILCLIIYLYKKKRYLIYSALTLLITFSSGIVSNFIWLTIEYPLKRLEISSLQKAGAIVVLSGSNNSPRFSAGIDLFKAKKSNKLIFTGGVNPYSENKTPRGDISLKKAISLGIPSENVYSTGVVLNTFQEAKAIKNLINTKIDLEKKDIILVTSAFHMKRAKKVFEREGIKVQGYPVAFNGKKIKTIFSNPLNWFPSARSLGSSTMSIREIIGRIIYRAM